jgi:hypothetical protein
MHCNNKNRLTTRLPGSDPTCIPSYCKNGYYVRNLNHRSQLNSFYFKSFSIDNNPDAENLKCMDCISGLDLALVPSSEKAGWPIENLTGASHSNAWVLNSRYTQIFSPTKKH